MNKIHYVFLLALLVVFWNSQIHAQDAIHQDTIIPFTNYFLKGEHYIVIRDNKYGVIDSVENFLIPLQYDYIFK
ncbi:MAG: hypothetical protein HY738_07330 [Bacteroidia bacterium]|nr:hypothetical protein [Bacteroidia bacterium]